MKIHRMWLIPALMVLFGFSSVFAARIVREEKVLAKQVLTRTALVIIRAHKVVREHKVYTGDLARAVRHQKFAKMLFVSGEYRRAINQSLRARRLAFMAIRANKGVVKSDEEMNGTEKKYGMNSPSPSDAELDANAQKSLPDESSKDEDIIKNGDVKLKADLDITTN